MKKVIIYGIGNNCKTLFLNNFINEIEVVAFVDANKFGELYRGKKIVSPEFIKDYRYDELWVTIISPDEVIRELTEKYEVPSDIIKDVTYINQLCFNRGLAGWKYVMLTNNIDYLNYPYESLKEKRVIQIIYLLRQKKQWVYHVETIYEEKVFIIRSHILSEIIQNGLLSIIESKFPESKKILILSDMVKGAYGYENRQNGSFHFEEVKDHFNFISTYHKGEAESLGVYYLPQPYCVKEFANLDSSYDNFVLFVGRAKDRLDCLYKIYKQLTNEGIDCRFWISQVDECLIDHSLTGVTYNVELLYEDYLELVRKCGCILELTYGGNETSMRYAEAVVYNKKLLINTESVKQREFYSSNFISVFDEQQLNFDYEWIKKRIKVDYKYDGRFDSENYFKLIKNI